jgi:putative endonuclease
LNKDILGKQGEKIAEKFMLSKGYELLCRNYRYNRAETDLILIEKKTNTLVFTEVKTRRSRTFGEPEESITIKKAEQMLKSADGFLSEHPEYEDYEKRIDVVTIFIQGNKKIINHIENALE